MILEGNSLHYTADEYKKLVEIFGKIDNIVINESTIVINGEYKLSFMQLSDMIKKEDAFKLDDFKFFADNVVSKGDNVGKGDNIDNVALVATPVATPVATDVATDVATVDKNTENALRKIGGEIGAPIVGHGITPTAVAVVATATTATATATDANGKEDYWKNKYMAQFTNLKNINELINLRSESEITSIEFIEHVQKIFAECEFSNSNEINAIKKVFNFQRPENRAKVIESFNTKQKVALLGQFPNFLMKYFTIDELALFRIYKFSNYEINEKVVQNCSELSDDVLVHLMMKFVGNGVHSNIINEIKKRDIKPTNKAVEIFLTYYP